jgi:formylglycine-generating enzyme required for sulfatase activity
MVFIPAGKFIMGTPESVDQLNAEGPQHEVHFANPFAIGKYEVTFDEWEACVSAGGCPGALDNNNWGSGGRPVINITWDNAKLYVAWLSNLTGKSYRLPSEAEWEYAARAGTTTIYFFGDEPTPLGEYAWYRVNSDEKTQPVGKKKPNAFGVYDVYGNVGEWVEDIWHENYSYADVPLDGSAWLKGGESRNRRVIRGGTWFDVAGNIRSGKRRDAYSYGGTYSIGFRVARTMEATQ